MGQSNYPPQGRPGQRQILWIPSFMARWGIAPAAQTGVAFRVHLSAVWIPYATTISRININQQVAGGAGTFFKVGLYRDNGGTPVGGALLSESASVAADGSNGGKDVALTTPISVSPGLIWVALETNDGTFQFLRHSTTAPFIDQGSELLRGSHYTLGSFTSLTDPCPAVTGNTAASFTCSLRADT